MKLAISIIIASGSIILAVTGIVAKAIRSSARYMDDSFRWGGRDNG